MAQPLPMFRGELKILIPLMWPMVIAGQLDYLIDVVGLFWMGRLVGTPGLELAVVLIPWSIVLTWCVLLVPRGASALLAHDVGAGRKDLLDSVWSAMVLQVIVVLVCLTCAFAVIPLGWDSFARGESYTQSQAQTYYALMLVAVACFGLYKVLLLAICATGRTRVLTIRSLLILIGIAVLSPIFIKTLGFGIYGLAVTELLLSSGLLIYLIVFVSKRGKDIGLGIYTSWRRKISRWPTILSAAGPMQVSRILGGLSLGFYFLVAKSDGGAAVAGFGIVLQLLFFVASLATAWGNAAGILFGHRLGANDSAGCKEVLRIATIGAVVIGGLCCLLAALLTRPLASIFTTSPTIIQAAETALDQLKWSYVAVALTNAFYPLFEATTRTVRAAIASILADAAGLVWLFSAGDGVKHAATTILVVQFLKLILVSLAIPMTILPAIRPRSSRTTGH